MSQPDPLLDGLLLGDDDGGVKSAELVAEPATPLTPLGDPVLPIVAPDTDVDQLLVVDHQPAAAAIPVPPPPPAPPIAPPKPAAAPTPAPKPAASASVAAPTTFLERLEARFASIDQKLDALAAGNVGASDPDALRELKALLVTLRRQKDEVESVIEDARDAIKDARKAKESADAQFADFQRWFGDWRK